MPFLDGKGVFSGAKDFSRKLSEKTNLRLVSINSGNSFHLCGDRFLEEKEMINFLMEAILLSDKNHGADTRWIAHRLLSSELCLRLTNNTGLFLHEPRII